MNQQLRELNRSLTRRLLRLTEDLRAQAIEQADAIVTHVEVNERHGVGVLVRRLFGGESNIVSIRSRDLYGGSQDFGLRHLCIPQTGATRDRAFWNVARALRGITVKRVLCIPYYPDDVWNGIALAEMFRAPLCTYIMDDQNLFIDGIPDDLMRELVSISSLCLAISPELREGYQAKYGKLFWFVPPLVPARFIPRKANEISEISESPAIVGNIWGQRWIELLRETVRGTGITLRWFNNGEFRWLPCSKEELAADGIVPQESPHRDADLIAILRRSPYVVVPSGTMDSTDDRGFIAKLSFPSRIPYIFATSHAPLLVLGSAETSAARFVRAAGIGIVAPYRRDAFLDAIREITEPATNSRFRRRAFELSARYTDEGAADWIWRSLAQGRPVDERYQELLDPVRATPDR